MRLISTLMNLTPQGIAAKIGIGFGGAALFVFSVCLYTYLNAKLFEMATRNGVEIGGSRAVIANLKASQGVHDAIESNRPQVIERIERRINPINQELQRKVEQLEKDLNNVSGEMEKCLNLPAPDSLTERLREYQREDNRSNRSTTDNNPV